MPEQHVEDIGILGGRWAFPLPFKTSCSPTRRGERAASEDVQLQCSTASLIRKEHRSRVSADQEPVNTSARANQQHGEHATIRAAEHARGLTSTGRPPMDS
eukprot:2598563-Alexandrium_andersonii.AAC.1